MSVRIMTAQDEPRIYWCRVDRIWKNDGPVGWYDRETNTVIRVEPGKPTDLASVPFWLRWLVAVYGNWNRGAIIHDDLYRRRGVLACGKILTRKQCDRIFLDIAIVDGTNAFVAFVGYYGIRVNPVNWPWFKKWGGAK
jgi:hypothetical protein